MESPEKSEEILPTPNPTIQQAVSAQFLKLPTPAIDHNTTSYLDNIKRLEPFSFPHQSPNANSKLPGTLPNVRHLLNAYNIIVRYNTITKKLDIIIPNYTGSPDNSDSIKLTIVCSLAAANNMSISSIPVSYTHLDVYKRQQPNLLAVNSQNPTVQLPEKLKRCLHNKTSTSL